MKITVQANHPHHSQLARAGRFWSVKEATEVEVIDTEEDPPPVIVQVRNNTTQRMEDRERPNPTVIGRATLKILRADSRLSIQQLDSITSKAADKAVNAAQREVARLAGENAALVAKLAAAEQERDEAKELVAERDAQLDAKNNRLVTAEARLAEFDAATEVVEPDGKKGSRKR
jgi:hypothetical protein